MYVSGPTDADATLPGWGILRTARRDFPHPAALTADTAHTDRLATYLTDMLQPYGLGLDTGTLRAGRGQSYGEMAAAIIEDIVPPDEHVDLLILAYAIPDITPGRATATYLSDICPGRPFAFAISDQGSAAAFTGLQLLREYARTGGCERGLLIIVEQADLPYDPGVPVAVPSGHTAVALLCGATPAGARITGIDTGSDIPAVDTGTTLIASASLADAVPAGGDVRVAGAGRPTTGIWWDLTGILASADHQPRIVLADHDTDLGCLSTATLDVLREPLPDEPLPDEALPDEPRRDELVAG